MIEGPSHLLHYLHKVLLLMICQCWKNAQTNQQQQQQQHKTNIVDFNAILIVVVENWLWELHDVEYHGVHLINLSKSSRFVSVNHVSVCQKTEKTIFYSAAATSLRSSSGLYNVYTGCSTLHSIFLLELCNVSYLMMDQNFFFQGLIIRFHTDHLRAV